MNDMIAPERFAPGVKALHDATPYPFSDHRHALAYGRALAAVSLLVGDPTAVMYIDVQPAHKSEADAGDAYEVVAVAHGAVVTAGFTLDVPSSVAKAYPWKHLTALTVSADGEFSTPYARIVWLGFGDKSFRIPAPKPGALDAVVERARRALGSA